MDEIFDENGIPVEVGPGQMKIMLPCDQKDFGRFISSLLGKPQTIEKTFKFSYQFGRDDVSNTFQLIDQRINQQNDATLLQFTVKIVYDNDESVLFNSFEDFRIYKEVQPLASVGVVLSWTYLITFRNKTVPEKQEIDLVFRSDISSSDSIFEDGIDITKSRRYFPTSSITLRICHTDRTWGTDIESLVSGHVKTLKIEESPFKAFIRKHSGKLGLAVFFLMLCGAFFTAYTVEGKVDFAHHNKLAVIAESTIRGPELLNDKFDFIASFLVNGKWGESVIDPLLFVGVSFIIAVFFGITVCDKANSTQYSFVLLSKEAETRRDKVYKKTRLDWRLFFISLGASVITGITSNVLFAMYFSKFIAK